MSDIDHHDVDARRDERGGALVRVTGDPDRGGGQQTRVLHELHLAHLLIDGQVAVDHAEAAKAAEGDGHARLGHGVHRRGEDRDGEGDVLC